MTTFDVERMRMAAEEYMMFAHCTLERVDGRFAHPRRWKEELR